MTSVESLIEDLRKIEPEEVVVVAIKNGSARIMFSPMLDSHLTYAAMVLQASVTRNLIAQLDAAEATAGDLASLKGEPQ